MKRLVWFLLMVCLICSPAVGSAAGKGGVDPVKIRRELRQILASPEYSPVKPSLFDRWMERASKAVGNGIKRFLGWIVGHLTFGESGTAGVIATIGAWLVAIGFVVLLWLVIRKLAASGQAQGDAPPGTASCDMPSAKPLIRQAAKLAETGDYRGAFRAAYLASIAYLDEIRALRFERSRTNWEYLRELQQGGHERPHGELRPLTADFDRKIYGRETCGREDYLKAAAVYDRLSSEEAR